jgi:hypothetical protein
VNHPTGVKREKEGKNGQAHLGFEAVFDEQGENKGEANQ